MLRCLRWHINCRVTLEKANRLQHEPSLITRHHWIVLRPHKVGYLQQSVRQIVCGVRSTAWTNELIGLTMLVHQNLRIYAVAVI